MPSAELENPGRIGRLKLEPPSEGHLEQDDQLLADLIVAARTLREAIDGLPADGMDP